MGDGELLRNEKESLYEQEEENTEVARENEIFRKVDETGGHGLDD